MATAVFNYKEPEIKPIWEVEGHDLKNVAGDGNCLISSLILGHLSRFINNPKIFIIEAKKMFPNIVQDQKWTEEYLDEQYYKLLNNFANLQNPENIADLKPWILSFRKKVVLYIRENLEIAFSSTRDTFFKTILEQIKLDISKSIEQSDDQKNVELNNKYVADIIVINEPVAFCNNLLLPKSEIEQVHDYLNQLEKDGNWCEEIVVDAVCNILESNILIKNPLISTNGLSIWNETHRPIDENIKAKKEITLYFDPNIKHYNYYQINSDWQDKQIKSYRKKILDKKEELFSCSEEELILLKHDQDEKLNKLQENQDKLEELLLEEQSELKSVDRNKLIELKLFYEEQSISILKEIEITDNDIAQHYQSKAIEDSLVGEEQEFFCD